MKRFCITHVECGGPEYVEAEDPRAALMLSHRTFRYAFEADGPGTHEWPEYSGAVALAKKGQLSFEPSTYGDEWIDRCNVGRVSGDYPPRVGPVWVVSFNKSDDSYFVYEVGRV